MSRIRALLSRTGSPMISSSARMLPGESSLSKMTMVDWVASASIRTSWAFPSPMKLWESGVWRFCSTLPVQKPPAVSRRSSSSSSVLSVAVSSSAKQSAFSPTRTARSCVCLSNLSSMLPPFFSWETPVSPPAALPLLPFLLLYHTSAPRTTTKIQKSRTASRSAGFAGLTSGQTAC